MPGLTLTTSAVASSVELAYPNVLAIAAANGDYTTLSGALAAISDAAADNQYLVLVFGPVAETGTITAKSYVHVTGLAGAEVTITATDGSTGIAFDDMVSSTWRDLRIIRAGAESNAFFGAVTFSGTTDATVQMIDCYVANTTTGSGAANHRLGIYVTETATPTLRNCEAIGGTGADWGIGIFYFDDSGGLATNCIGTGGANSANCRGINIKNSAHPTLINCIGTGGAGGAGCDGIAIYDAATPRLEGCTGVGGATGACVGIKTFGGSAPMLLDCTAIPGSGAASIGLHVLNSTRSEMYGCQVLPATIRGDEIVSTTTTFALSATQTAQLAAVGINVLAAGTGGATISIGTTLAGTDIINALSITATGQNSQALGAGALKLLAGGAVLYVTISGTGSPSVQIWWSAIVAFTYAYPLYIDSADMVIMDGCRIIGAPNSSACYITTTAVNAAKLRMSNCYIEARPKDSGSKVAIQAQSSFNPAPIYNCVLVGGTTNITAAAGTAAETNVVV